MNTSSFDTIHRNFYLHRYVMQYLTWRVLCGLNEHIEISFLVVGHMKFAPDWCFGLVKQKFRKTLVGCQDDLLRVVNQSATTNVGQLVGKEDGTTVMQQYDWAGYFSEFFKNLAFKGIKKWRHLVFSSAHPGKAVVRGHCSAEGETISLLKKDHLNWKPRPDDLPSVLPPPGLSLDRQQYLYNKIRQFVPDEHKDTVCPYPGTGASPATPTSSLAPSPQPSPPSTPPPTRRRRRKKNRSHS